MNEQPKDYPVEIEDTESNPLLIIMSILFCGAIAGLSITAFLVSL
jgi:hypothetical protein